MNALINLMTSAGPIGGAILAVVAILFFIMCVCYGFQMLRLFFKI